MQRQQYLTEGGITVLSTELRLYTNLLTSMTTQSVAETEQRLGVSGKSDLHAGFDSELQLLQHNINVRQGLLNTSATISPPTQSKRIQLGHAVRAMKTIDDNDEEIMFVVGGSEEPKVYTFKNIPVPTFGAKAPLLIPIVGKKVGDTISAKVNGLKDVELEILEIGLPILSQDLIDQALGQIFQKADAKMAA